MSTSFESPVATLPSGSAAEAPAVLTTWPASRSAWVAVWVAEHVVIAPGARVVGAQTIEPVSATGSTTVTPVKVTLPALRTVIA